MLVVCDFGVEFWCVDNVCFVFEDNKIAYMPLE